MNSRTTLILGVVLLVLVGYLVISNRADEEATAEATTVPIPTTAPRTPVIPETDANLVPVRMEISNTDEDGNSITRIFELDDTGIWAQTVPTYTQLISGSIISQANGMLNISSRIVMPADDNPLSAYGLDAPASTIVVVANRDGQAVRYTFLIGNQIVGGTGYYLQREGDDRVYVVDLTAVDSALALLTTIPIQIPAPVPPLTSTTGITSTGNITNTVPLTTTATITATGGLSNTAPLTSTTPVTTTP